MPTLAIAEFWLNGWGPSAATAVHCPDVDVVPVHERARIAASAGVLVADGRGVSVRANRAVVSVGGSNTADVDC